MGRKSAYLDSLVRVRQQRNQHVNEKNECNDKIRSK